MAKVLMRYTRGGKEKSMAEPFAAILEKTGLATRVVIPEPPAKKPRGRPRKIVAPVVVLEASEAPTVPQTKTYKRRDLKAEN